MRKYITALAAALLLTGCAANGSETSSASSESSGGTTAADATAPDETTGAAVTESAPETVNTGAPTEEAAAAECPVRAAYAEDVTGSYPEIYEFATDGEVETLVMFTAESAVRDFKVLALTCDNIDDNGNVTFSVEELFTAGELTPEHPALVGMSFFGTIPNNGISFVDASGAERRFAVDMSGKDGSLFMWEF